MAFPAPNAGDEGPERHQNGAAPFACGRARGTKVLNYPGWVWVPKGKFPID